MASDHRARLSRITGLDELIPYLRDEMGWPIEDGSLESVDELFFAFTPEELGIDPAAAAKINSIRRLRPLSSSQPWGIFFIEFEPKKLPVVVLRRLLGQLASKRRESANNPTRRSWAVEDLLFVSSIGESADRQLTFAHFAQGEEIGVLPTLQILGWDTEDTPLHLERVAETLTDALAWPDDEADQEGWREQWLSAFELEYREVITTADLLTARLAELAQRIRRRIREALEVETAAGPLTMMMAAIRESLVGDLTPDSFADMYAQTIPYGLLSARIAEPGATEAEVWTRHMRTNPFLRELMDAFLHTGRSATDRHVAQINFDELGLSDVVRLLDASNIEAIVRDFGNRNVREDPVIHFYELFLQQYDPEERMQRGVFYTPRPIVSYIVRSVHHALRETFGLSDGLADTSSWAEVAAASPSLEVPDGVDPDEPFVRILDPASGTGTFLVEVIDVIYETMCARWDGEGANGEERKTLWNEYVAEQLLPRLYGYEVLMAPYAIAHLRIDIKLHETGYDFEESERVHVYLTNALEPAHEVPAQLELMLPALAVEAEAVNQVKQSSRFTVVVGNPPYSNFSANLNEAARALVEPYKYVAGEKVVERNALQLERNLNDDYVKFVAMTERLIRRSGAGVGQLISNSVYCWSPSLRGMRAHLLETFEEIQILDLHGASQRGDAAARGQGDENVFDIEQPVAIGRFVSAPWVDERSVAYAELISPREEKYRVLGEQTAALDWHALTPTGPQFQFQPPLTEHADEYEDYRSLAELMPLYARGIGSDRDWLVVDFEAAPILARMMDIRDSEESDDELCDRIELRRKRSWNFKTARAALKDAPLGSYVRPIAYRAFDRRSIFFHPNWIASPSLPVMRHVVDDDGSPRPNLLLIAGRISRDKDSFLFWASRDLVDKGIISSVDNVSVFPAVTYARNSVGGGEDAQELNFSPDAVATIERRLGLKLADVGSPLEWAEAAIGYIYALLWAPSYRERFAPLLFRDLPRIPFSEDRELALSLCARGRELLTLHLMETPAQPDADAGSFVGPDAPAVESVSWSDDVVQISASGGFHGVTAADWGFKAGGYRVLYKWLKDRAPKRGRTGRALSAEDLEHFRAMVAAIRGTRLISARIQEEIDAAGGWQTAFR